MNNIKAGYQVVFTTWENDADHFKHNSIDGLSAATVRFYLELANLFRSTNNTQCKGFGNSGCTETGDKYHNSSIEDVQEAIAKVVANHPDADPEVLSAYSDEDFDAVHESLIDEILGYTVEYTDEEYFCRVFESADVFFYPEPVKNVTNEFVKDGK